MNNAFFLLLFIVFCLMSMGIAGLSLAPWVPTWKKDLPRIFKLAALKPGEVFYDLGCGNGKLVLYTAKNFKVKAIGLEIAVPLFLICKVRQFFSQDKNLSFKFKSFYNENLNYADVIYVFGRPETLKDKFKQKLKKELKPGSRVISYAFPIIGWLPKEISKPSPKDIEIYLYIMP